MIIKVVFASTLKGCQTPVQDEASIPTSLFSGWNIFWNAIFLPQLFQTYTKKSVEKKSILDSWHSTLKTTHYKNGWRRPTVWWTKASRNSKHAVN